jgi:hypothetical protein
MAGELTIDLRGTMMLNISCLVMGFVKNRLLASYLLRWPSPEVPERSRCAMLAEGQPCEPPASASASCIPLIIWSKAAPGPGTAVHGASQQLIEIDAEQIEHNRR